VSHSASSLLVTGASGNIGRAVRAQLDARPETRVTYLVSPSRPHPDAGESSLAIDLTDGPAVHRAVEHARPDAIIHLASLTGAACESDPLRAEQVNVGAVRTLAAAAEAFGVRRLVLASTAGVYGDKYRAPATEDAPLDLTSVYARTKREAESELERLSGGSAAVETVVARIFNVFGPLMASSLVTRLAASTPDAPVVLAGLDGFVRDYVHVDDVSRALVLASEVALADLHTVVNIGSGVATSNRMLVDAMSTSRELHYTVGPEINSYSCADVRLAKSLLGFEATLRPEG
jgi:UDP-glucose 4-epimerase